MEGIGGFDAAGKFEFDFFFFEERGNFGFDFVEGFGVGFVGFFDETFEIMVALWVDIREGDVGHFDAETSHVETVGERGENLEGFFGDFFLFVGRESGESAEVMETVGEFDDEDADISAEGNHEAEEIVAGFGEIGVDVAHAGASGAEFGDAVDEKGNRLAKFAFDVFEGGGSVFNGVVENAGGDGVFVHAPFLEDFFDSEGMVDERLATFAELAFVGLGGESDGFLDLLRHGIIIT